MNRNKEYWDLISALGDTPDRLDSAVARATARRKKTRAGKWLGIPAATLGGLASAFILLVNFSIPFALACARVPFLKGLTAAVAFSETLKTAVQNDYVQYVGQSQTVNGVTMTVHYLVLDQSQINVFFTIDAGPAECYWVSGDHEAEGHAIRGGYSTGSSRPTTGGDMETLQLGFTTEFTLPETFPLRLQVRPDGVRDETVAPTADSGGPWDHDSGREPEPVARFAFDIPLDPRFTAPPKVVEVNQWFEVEGQRFLVETMEIYPLTTKLTMRADENNTVQLNDLSLYLEDGTGMHSDMSGMLGLNGLIYLTNSVYFSDQSHITLCITGARWSPKGGGYADVNLKTGEAAGLPAWAEVDSLERIGGDVRLSVRYTAPVSSLLTMSYYDPQGGEHHTGGMSTGTSSDEATDYLLLEDYPWDTVRLSLSYTSFSVYDDPITVTLK